MKYLFILSVLNIFLISSCSQTRTVNEENEEVQLTTANAILDNLKMIDENLDENDVCIDEIDGFTEFFIVGYFASDRGCGNPDYYFAGKKVELDENTIREILLNGNFEQDNLLAVEAFHKGVTNHYDYSLTTIPDDFDTLQYSFSEPNPALLKGMIKSEIWIQERSGMLPEVRYHLSTLVFELDGTFVEHKTSNHFTVEFD